MNEYQLPISRATRRTHLNVSNEFYPLLDRLQKCCEIKYPNRKWNYEFYFNAAKEWEGKEEQLKERVLSIENELKLENA